VLRMSDTEQQQKHPLDAESLKVVVKLSSAAFWVSIIGGIGTNWFGAFARYRGRYPLISHSVLREFALFLGLSVCIALATGRRNWRLSVLVFWFVSIGVAGFFCIGSR
jgi:hypothetical protein